MMCLTEISNTKAISSELVMVMGGQHLATAN